MSDASDYLENAVLDHTLGTTPYTQPTAYIALYTVAPTDSTAGTEVSAGLGYTRQAVTFGAASGGTASNSAQITIGPNTTTNWGDIVGVALVDSSTIGAGNILFYTAISAVNITIGDRFFQNIGDLTVSLD